MKRLVRFQLTLSLVGVAAGVWGYWLARELDFAGQDGGQLGLRNHEIILMTYNRLGALVTLALALIGVVGVFVAKPAIGFVAGGGFALLTVQTLVQWRPETSNLLASSGTNLSFALMMAIGFAVTGWLSLVEPYRSDRPE